MDKDNHIIIATKCAPEENILNDIERAGLEAVELYLSDKFLSNAKETIKICRKFKNRYAIHTPRDGYNPDGLAELAEAIKAEIVIFHNVYWEDEYERIVGRFKDINTRLCLENTYSIHETVKFSRRFGIGSCVDLEHLQMECLGVYEEEFKRVIKESWHIHLTGYFYGSRLWHTHLHHSKKHSLDMLNLIKDAGYSGMVVSEAKMSLQTYSEFKELNDFYQHWRGQ